LFLKAAVSESEIQEIYDNVVANDTYEIATDLLLMMG
jgi:hypothetical protein